MTPASKPANESQRLSAVYEYNILDSLPEKEYDDITKIAASISGMPIALITIIDNDRQWFKSKIGIDGMDTHRDHAFCAHAILKPEDMFIVPDTSKDDRFYDNPYVTGDPYIGFYAGVPLVNDGGLPLGTLCVLDSNPKEISVEQKETLKALARQVMCYFEIRKKNAQLARQKLEMEELNNDLSRFAHVVAHDVKSPCSSIAMSAALIKEMFSGKVDKELGQFLDMMEDTAHAAIRMVDGILHHTHTVNNAEIEKVYFTFGDLTNELKKLVTITDDFSLHTINPDLKLFTARYMLQQILVNLINNAIKYNDKPKGTVIVSATDDGSHYTFTVQDNGPGIKKEHQEKIFEMFSTFGKTDRFNKKGTGIGLSTVKKLVEKLNGTISVTSELGKGSCFEFTIGK